MTPTMIITFENYLLDRWHPAVAPATALIYDRDRSTERRQLAICDGNQWHSYYQVRNVIVEPIK